MAKRKRRGCRYYCDGYCFWNGDTGRVCDTDNNAHDGYCPKAESDKEFDIIEHCYEVNGNCCVCTLTNCSHRKKD